MSPLTKSLLVLFLIHLETVSAQTLNTSTKPSHLNYNCQCLDPELMKGIWQATDSTKHKIEFTFHEKGFYLRNFEDTIMHQFNAFQFSLKDSLSFVSNEGVIFKWPPDNCYVNLISNDTIEVIYGVFGAEAVSVIYERLDQ